MFEALGEELPLLERFAEAFLVILALFGLLVWLMRRFGSSRANANAARGRQPRLAVIDVAVVEGRRLVLIRRDNVEHLILIGSSGDLVVEPILVGAWPLASWREIPSPSAPCVSEALARAGYAGSRGDFPPHLWEPGCRPEPC
jgi:flagellar protein FliO/FliZ